MASLADAIGRPVGYAPGPGMVWRNGQWVPYQIASPGGPGDAAHDSWTRAEENRMHTMRSINQRERMRTPINSGQTLANGMPTQMPAHSNPESFARANYGFLAGFLNHPEIGPLLRQAANEGWDEMTLYGKVTQTNFWRNTSAAARTWWQLTNEDPAEARRLVGQTAATIQNRARTLGLGMSGAQITNLAATATQNGWTDAQTVDAILQQVNWATIEAGDLTALRDDVKAVGADYLVGVSEATAQNYAAKIASGEMSMEGVQSAMLKQAKARFSWMADELDQGMTVKQYLQPVRDTIARELEMAPEAINLMDSKWLSMIETRGEDGNLRAATLNEAMLAARREPEWANTRNAQETSTSMINMISDMFGRSAA